MKMSFLANSVNGVATGVEQMVFGRQLNSPV